MTVETDLGSTGGGAELDASRVDLRDPSLYANRELSWLDFNDRVLWEAKDPRNPLLERIRYLAITASNLDEFTSKRIGWLRLLMKRDPGHRTVDGLTVAEQLVAVRERVHAMQRELDECWRDLLEPQLEEHGYRVVSFDSLDAATHARLRDDFLAMIFPVLTPLVVDPSHPFPFISGNSQSLILSVRADGERRHFARLKVPPNRPRFVEAGEGVLVRIEDLILGHLDLLFPGAEVTDACLMRVLRSSEIGTPGEDAADLLELIENTIARRRMADAVSVELHGAISETQLGLLLQELQLGPEDVYTSDVMLGLADLTQLASLPVPDESFAPFVPAVPS
ncbi:MAG: polyphosphate kinase 1, partial [Dehalococcoidia bacterium]